MSMAIGMSVVVIFVLIMSLIIPVLIGVYVYRDAKRRGMNAGVWTLVSVLAPGLIGFIIYLLVRSNYSDLNCPQCGAQVKDDYVICPRCGAKLMPSCPNCGTMVESDWVMCPKCATRLPSVQTDVQAPIRAKDKSIGKIIAVVIIVPVVLFLFLGVIVGLNAFTSAGASNLGITTIDEYLSQMDNDEIGQWIDNVKSDMSKAHVLMNQSENGDNIRVRYLIYIPQLVDQPGYSFGANWGLFGDTMKIELSRANGECGNTLILVTYSGDSVPSLKVYLGDERMDCDITEVEYSLSPVDLSTFDIMESSIGEGMPGGSLTVITETEIVVDND